MLFPCPNIQSNFGSVNHRTTSMHSIIIPNTIWIQIPPKYCCSHLWQHFHSFHLFSLLVITVQYVTPFWCLWSGNPGESSCPSSTVGHQEHEKRTDSISEIFNRVGRISFKPVGVFTKLLSVGVPINFSLDKGGEYFTT